MRFIITGNDGCHSAVPVHQKVHQQLHCTTSNKNKVYKAYEAYPSLKYARHIISFIQVRRSVSEHSVLEKMWSSNTVTIRTFLQILYIAKTSVIPSKKFTAIWLSGRAVKAVD